MPSPTPERAIRVSVLDTALAITLDLQYEQNPATCDMVWEALPLDSFLGHVVVSGGGLWIPTRETYVGPRAKVQRRRGSVYFYPPMQSIAITYGAVSESAYVNEFARVREADLDTLTRIGKLVWDETIAPPRKTLTRVRLERA